MTSIGVKPNIIKAKSMAFRERISTSGKKNGRVIKAAVRQMMIFKEGVSIDAIMICQESIKMGPPTRQANFTIAPSKSLANKT